MEIIRPYLEAIYFVTGGPLLAVFAFLALKQIQVAKQTAKTSSLREAYRLAAEQAHVYATEIIPKLNELDRLINEKKITLFSEAKVTVQKGQVRIVRTKAGNELDQIIQILPLFLETINRMETFALWFTSKVAAESIAYSSVGPSFVRSVQKLLPPIVVSANNQNHENLMRLFLLWYERLEKGRLERERSTLEAKLRGMKAEEVVPIGGGDSGGA
jgi:hypothetical protein